MNILIVILISILVFGGGGGYFVHNAWGAPGLGGWLSVVLLVVAVASWQVRNFALLLDETAALMSTPLLTGILVDLGKWRDWARERNDFAAAVMLGTAIHHASAEIARREVQPKGNLT